MIMPNKANAFIDLDYPESRKKKAIKSLHDAFLKAEAGEWEDVTSMGLEYPENMDSIIKAYYSEMPDKIRYILPLKWYMASGKASDYVCKAVAIAGKYKPVLWIGKGLVKGDKVNVFCCVKNGDKETVKDCLSWATDYGTAYIKAMKINGKVFEAFILKDKITAFDNASAEPVIQFQSVYAVQQVFPNLPLSCL